MYAIISKNFEIIIEITVFEPPVNKVITRLSITNSNLIDVCICTCSCKSVSSDSSVIVTNFSVQKTQLFYNYFVR